MPWVAHLVRVRARVAFATYESVIPSAARNPYSLYGALGEGILRLRSE